MSEPDWTSLYAEHLAKITADAQAALAACDTAGLVIHAGSHRLYHADDQEIPFRQVPHFARFAPLEGAEHLLLVPREGSPRLIRVVPQDFWHEPPAEPPAWVSEALEVEVCVLPVGLAWSDADEGVWPRLEHGAQDPAPQRQVLQSACRREGEGEGLCLYVSVSVSVSVCVCVCLCVAASLTANAISKKEMSDDHGRSLHSTRQRFKLWRPGHMDTQGEGM